MFSSNSADVHLRLTPEQRRAIERLAKRDNISVEEAILRAVEQALATEVDASAFPAGTPFHGLDDLLADLGEGPVDLSTNRHTSTISARETGYLGHRIAFIDAKRSR